MRRFISQLQSRADDAEAALLAGRQPNSIEVEVAGTLTFDGSHDGRKSYYTETATSGAVVADLENDGRTDLVAGSGTPFPSAVNGKVYVWLPGALGATPWPAFRQDPASRRGVAPGSLTCPGEAPARFYTVTPCRIVDTRDPVGTFGGPSLAAMTTRDEAARRFRVTLFRVMTVQLLTLVLLWLLQQRYSF